MAYLPIPFWGTRLSYSIIDKEENYMGKNYIKQFMEDNNLAIEEKFEVCFKLMDVTVIVYIDKDYELKVGTSDKCFESELTHLLLTGNVKIQKITAPPLGLKPKWAHDEERAKDMLEAVKRYKAHNQPIPDEWVEEARAFLLKPSSSVMDGVIELVKGAEKKAIKKICDEKGIKISFAN